MTGESANDDLPTHFDAAIARSDKLMLLGDYVAALVILESLTTDSPCTIEQNQEVLRAKARIWVARRYAQRAKESMRNACDWPREIMNRQQIQIPDIHTTFVTIVACGEELENDKILFQARELLSPMGAPESCSFAAVGSDRH